MTESSAKRTRADARTVIADLLYQHHTGGDIVSADEFLAALRSHGYAVVPCKHDGRAGLTHEMCAAFWDAFQAAVNRGRGHFESTNAGYNAMIAAAPQSSAPDTA